MFRKMRRFKQEISKENCIALLKDSKRAILSMNGDDNYPYSIPINFIYEETTNKIYIHCALEGYKIDCINNNDKICFVVCDNGYKNDDEWAYKVNSVIIFGRAKIILDKEIVYDKLTMIGKKYYPVEIDVENEATNSLSRAQIIEINIEHMSGKLVFEK